MRKDNQWTRREWIQITSHSALAGIVWAPPYRVEITSAAKSGTNWLVIRVANTWANRLTGDLRLPKEQRYTQTNIDWAGRSGMPELTLLESGLLGPVRIISAYQMMVA